MRFVQKRHCALHQNSRDRTVLPPTQGGRSSQVPAHEQGTVPEHRSPGAALVSCPLLLHGWLRCREDEVVRSLPHTLVCSHSFCAACLRSVESPQNSITCPECKVVTALGEDGVDGLQVDSRILGRVFVAKMNSGKSSSKKASTRRVEVCSPPSDENQQGPEKVKLLDEALSRAVESLETLEDAQQTLVSGIRTRLAREKTRMEKEIEDCVSKAVRMIYRRRDQLVSELGCLDGLFAGSWEACGRLEEKRKALRAAVQKARHIQQAPLLESYCDLDELLETLRAPVDTEPHGMSYTSLCSGLGCVLQASVLAESLRNSLKLAESSLEDWTESPPAERGPGQPPGGRGAREKRGRQGSGGPSLPRAGPTPRPDRRSPDVAIEEMKEETSADVESPPFKPTRRPPGVCTKPRRKPQRGRATAPKFKVLREWVAVTHVVSPSHFYVRYVSEHKTGLKLARTIHAICSEKESCFAADDHVQSGEVVFVRGKDDVWCRALVCELFQSGVLESVAQCPAAQVARLQVIFPDYGFNKEISVCAEQELRGLSELLRKADDSAQLSLQHWPPLAVRCALNDLVPPDPLKGWSGEACEEIRGLMGLNCVEMQVFGQGHDRLLVDLKKTDSNNYNAYLSLREHLVLMELARFYTPQAVPEVRKPLQFYPPVSPKLNVDLKAVVSHVNTPSDFYVQLVDSMEFMLLHAKLQECYSSPGAESRLRVHCPVLSQACVALYEQRDWCRAHIVGLHGDQTAEVLFVDFGNRRVVSLAELRQMKDEFFALPAMALRCCLADVVCSGERWSEETAEEFRTLTEHKLLTVLATELLSNPPGALVYMYEASENPAEPAVSVGELLVQRGLACFIKRSRVELSAASPLPDAAVWDPPLEEEEGEEEEEDGAPQLQPDLILPSCAKDLRVRVTHVSSPGHICVQLLQFDGQLKRIHDALKSEYSESEPQDVDWAAEMSCAADVNGVWERGRVRSVLASDVAKVLRCDFGDTVDLPCAKLRPLKPELEGSLLLECRLPNIRPAGGRSAWTATACDFVSRHLSGITATVTVQEPFAEERPLPVTLTFSSGAAQDTSMADFLVSEGLALRERRVEPATAPAAGFPADPEDALPSTPPRHRSALCATAELERVRTRAYLPPELPSCGRARMTVTAVSDEGVVYAVTPQGEREFERLKELLQQHVRSLPHQKHWSWRNVLGCALIGPDMLWYRGQVLEVVGGYVKVRYVDQGIVENIPACHVYPIVLYENIPQLCLPLKIHGVVPIGSVWQWDAVALLKELLLSRSVDVQVMELPEEPRGPVTVDVTLDGMPLSRILLHHQHASPVQQFPGSQCLRDYAATPPTPVLDDWDADVEGLEEPKPVLRVYDDLKLPGDGKRFQVKITHIRTPNVVFLCLTDSPDTFEEALDQVNNDVESLPRLADFPIEGPCLAEYSDGRYYRAKLLGFSEVGADGVKLLVRHVDFGSDDILPPSKLRRLPAALLRFQCRAARVRLAGFRPPRGCKEAQRLSYRPEWSMQAMTEMMDLLRGHLDAVVTEAEPRLTVLLTNAEGRPAHLPLVEKGLAEFE